jgi:hypothetical protein
MESNGALVTRFTAESTQKEMDLNFLLYQEETRKFFGDDLTFTLKSLLVGDVGFNYRNRLAHGLLDGNQFGPNPVNYIWAATIYLCWLGQRAAEKSAESATKTPDVSDEDI